MAEEWAAGVLVLAGLTLLLQGGQAIGSASARGTSGKWSAQLRHVECSYFWPRCFSCVGSCGAQWGRMWKAYFPIGSFLEAPRTLGLFGFLPPPAALAAPRGSRAHPGQHE
jgi:hypothetical protein